MKGYLAISSLTTHFTRNASPLGLTVLQLPKPRVTLLSLGQNCENTAEFNTSLLH